MVVEYIRYKIPTELHQKFLADYAMAGGALKQSDACRAYELTQCEEEPERFTLRIEWTSIDDHLKRFRGSAEFGSFFGYIQPYLKLIEDMQHYNFTAVMHRK